MVSGNTDKTVQMIILLRTMIGNNKIEIHWQFLLQAVFPHLLNVYWFGLLRNCFVVSIVH